MATVVLKTLGVLAGFATVLLLGEPARAQDACVVPEAGGWINDRARNKQVSRVEIERTCHGETATIRMRVFTQCAPRDCKWGWQPAYRNRSGRLAARFPGFFGSRSVEVIHMGARIEALVTIDPHDPTEPDDFHSAILTRD